MRLSTHPGMFGAGLLAISLAGLGLAGCSSPKDQMSATIKHALKKTPQTAPLWLAITGASVENAEGKPVKGILTVVPASASGSSRAQGLEALAKAGWVKPMRASGWAVQSMTGTPTYRLAPSSTDGLKAKLHQAREAIEASHENDIWAHITEQEKALFRTATIVNGYQYKTSDPVSGFYYAYRGGRGYDVSAVQALQKTGYLKERDMRLYSFSGGQVFAEHVKHRPAHFHSVMVHAYFMTPKAAGLLRQNKAHDPLVRVQSETVKRIVRASSKPIEGHPHAWAVTADLVSHKTPINSLHAVMTAVTNNGMNEPLDPSGTHETMLMLFKSAQLKHVIPGATEGIGSTPGKSTNLTLYRLTAQGKKHLSAGMGGVDSGWQAAVGQWTLGKIDNYSKPSSRYHGDVMVDAQFVFHPTLAKGPLSGLEKLAASHQHIPSAGQTEKEQCLLMPMHKGFQFDGCQSAGG